MKAPCAMGEFEFNPEILGSGCVAWVCVAVMVVSLIHWLIMGEIDPGSGIIGIATAMVLGFIAINPPDPMLSPILAVALIATLILAPITRLMVNRAALSALEVEAIGSAYELLSTKPDNFGAQIRLARSLYNRGITAHAIAIAQSALANVPERLFPEEHRMVAGWRHAAKGDDSPVRIRCVECGTPNFPGALFCEKCGAPFLLDYAQGRWVRSSTVRRAVILWIAAIAALVGIPTAAVALPPTFAAAVVVVLLLAGVTLLVRGFRDSSAGNK